MCHYLHLLSKFIDFIHQISEIIIFGIAGIIIWFFALDFLFFIFQTFQKTSSK